MENAVTSIADAICYGEMLWDLLPDGPQPGGAPLNVAYHLNKLGINSSIISKIGNDKSGLDLILLLDKWGIGKQLLQTDNEYATSEVLVKINDSNEASYEILYPVAWDFIRQDQIVKEQLKSASFLVYGSLSCRNNTSRETLLNLLENNVTNVFDINLREPYVNKEVLQMLLSKADVVKFNEYELNHTSLLFGGLNKKETEKVSYLQNIFNIPEIIVTKGGAGASYYIDDRDYHATGPPITLMDTIGSGDAFLAAFISGRHQDNDPQIIINNAVAMGAFIATKKGGCPEYQLPEFINFKNQLL